MAEPVRDRATLLVRGHRVGVLAIMVAVVLLACRHESAGAIKRLLADPSQYDGQLVSLSGATRKLDVRVSRRGNPYYTFQLDDGSGRLTVFQFGAPACPAGSRVNVEGVFRQVKEIGGHTFYNQVDATRVVCDQGRP